MYFSCPSVQVKQRADYGPASLHPLNFNTAISLRNEVSIELQSIYPREVWSRYPMAWHGTALIFSL